MGPQISIPKIGETKPKKNEYRVQIPRLANVLFFGSSGPGPQAIPLTVFTGCFHWNWILFCLIKGVDSLRSPIGKFQYSCFHNHWFHIAWIAKIGFNFRQFGNLGISLFLVLVLSSFCSFLFLFLFWLFLCFLFWRFLSTPSSEGVFFFGTLSLERVLIF